MKREKHSSHFDNVFNSIENAISALDRGLVVVENGAATNIYRESPGEDSHSLAFGCERECVQALDEIIERAQSIKARRFESRQKENPSNNLTLSAYPLIKPRGLCTGAVMTCLEETRIAGVEADFSERRSLYNLVGKSHQMQRIYSLIERLANVDSNVLISGESGTGKELVAEALHHLGTRKNKHLVKVNCSALSESLLESELFGHIRGAFTGAVHDKVGRFQKADGGTLFLDEVGDLSPKVQVTLLRVLEEKQIERVGDSTPVRVDARIITATNKNLEELVKSGEFRADLLFRLRVVEVALPPLRERREDISLLTEHFIKKFNRSMHRTIDGVPADVEATLLTHSWPGNIRELQSALEHAFVVCGDNTITFEHLPLYITSASPTPSYSRGATDNANAQAIILALEKMAGNKKGAARLLGIDRKTLYRHIAKYHITTFRKG